MTDPSIATTAWVTSSNKDGASGTSFPTSSPQSSQANLASPDHSESQPPPLHLQVGPVTTPVIDAAPPPTTEVRISPAVDLTIGGEDFLQVPSEFLLVPGSNSQLTHVRPIGAGGGGEVHEVPPTLPSCNTDRSLRSAITLAK
jgi:hypothetical protein